MGRDDIPIGPTGQHPHGKLGPDDEGGLTVAITVTKGSVVLHFGTGISWLGLPPDGARRLAVLLIRKAGECDGKPFTLEF